MNKIVSRENFKGLPSSLTEGVRKAQVIFNSIKSFEDIEHVFLKGAGLSKNTYRSYLAAIKQLYEFTGHRNPLQITPADIERFYDDLIIKVDRNTASQRIAGLKKFFSGIRGVIPIYTSPFELMTEKLKKKISRTKKGNRIKPALMKSEATSLLTWLKDQQSIQGFENYAIIFMLITSGLRADELCQLHWKDIEALDGSIKAFFTGKGNKDAEQELYGPAVQACREYFRKAFKRDPAPVDNLFYTIESAGHPAKPLTPHCLWERSKRIGAGAKKEGIIKRDIIFSPHLFRRSYATLLNKSGMRLKSIQVKTRHSNIETLTKHYIDNSESAWPYLQKLFKNDKKG
jgi:site-specific recombinase XerD